MAYENLRSPLGPDGYPVTQDDYDALLGALRAIVAQYDASPDGPLGKGFTNEPFLRARDLVQEKCTEAVSVHRQGDV